MAKQCAICTKTIGTFTPKHTTSDKRIICLKCIEEAGYGTDTSIQAFQNISRKSFEEIMNHKERYQNFNPTKNIANIIDVDTKQSKFRISAMTSTADIFDLNSISSYELVENNSTISSGGLGRATLGAITFGSTGALVGAVTGRKKTKSVIEKLLIKITLNNLETPVIYINLINSPIKQDSMEYSSALRTADIILSSLNTVISQMTAVDSKKNDDNTIVSTADEIRKYKELMDDGIISSEEFEVKKKELLNL